MFCGKCGAKNESGAKFCESCGNKLENKEIKNEFNKPLNNVSKKIRSIPKKKKIIMSFVLLIIMLAIIILCILLNNPLKKVEDKLGDYYANYSDKSSEELIEIGKILKSNKDNEKLLENIKNSVQREVNKWTKNFNKEYKNKKELDKAYEKLTGALNDIYDYFNGLEYMLDYDLYSELTEEANTLYYSKTNYLSGQEYENDDNDYYAYYYYNKVNEIDCYYNKTKNFINNYVKDEIATFKKEAEKLINITNKSTTKEILDCYLKQIKYINENKITNNIDLSSSEEYQKLYENASRKIVDNTKKLTQEVINDLDYEEAIEIIEKSMDAIDYDSDEYKDLNTLKEEYKGKLPDSLLTKYLVSSTWGSGDSKYSKIINEVEYDSNIYFQFEGENQSRVYRLNGDYQKLKTKIVRGKDWDKNFTGYFIITGDDKELYKSANITKNSELDSDIDIDVTGVDDLKIEFVTKSETDSWDNFYIYLVEPYLYK